MKRKKEEHIINLRLFNFKNYNDVRVDLYKKEELNNGEDAAKFGSDIKDSVVKCFKNKYQGERSYVTAEKIDLSRINLITPMQEQNCTTAKIGKIDFEEKKYFDLPIPLVGLYNLETGISKNDYTIVIKSNNSAIRLPCPICGTRHKDALWPVWLFLEEKERPICLECARAEAPELLKKIDYDEIVSKE